MAKCFCRVADYMRIRCYVHTLSGTLHQIWPTGQSKSGQSPGSERDDAMLAECRAVV